MSSDAAPLTGPDLRAAGAALTEIADGGLMRGHADGEAVVLARRGNEIFAVGATCTHYSGPLAEGLLVGDTLRCPWHHACYSIRTGEAVRAPALNPIACWTVEQRGGRVYVTGKQASRDPLAPADKKASVAAPPASVVIIGAGAAGSAAAEMLRRQAYSGPITVIDGEPDSPYDRPNLSKDFLAGTAPAEWIPLRAPGFYEEHQIELVRERAVGVDTKQSRVVLAGGRTLSYGALLLATGAEPIRLDIPGNDRTFVFTLRSLADSQAIIRACGRAKHVVVIGASFIGLEVAAALRHRNLDVTVVAPESRPLERVLGPALGDYIRKLHESRGVVFQLSTKPVRIDEKGVQLENGVSLPADFVVIGVGVRPRLDLAQQAGLKIDRGVMVNEYLETSVPRVYAAGDIARWPDPHTGAAIRVEHWVVAQRQGQTAARNILGARQKFDSVPFFWSQHYENSINYCGHAEQWDRIDVTGRPADGNASVAYRSGAKTFAVASIAQDHANLEAEAALERFDEKALAVIVPRG